MATARCLFGTRRRAIDLATTALVLSLVLTRLSGDRMSWRWPFQKERLVGTLGGFLLLGWLTVLLPTYHAVSMISEA